MSISRIFAGGMIALLTACLTLAQGRGGRPADQQAPPQQSAPTETRTTTPRRARRKILGHTSQRAHRRTADQLHRDRRYLCHQV